MKKILVLGGTGAMGRYLVPELLSMGYQVDVVTLDNIKSTNSNLRYFQLDAMQDSNIESLLKNEYNGIVDFMIYSNPDITFRNRMNLFLRNTEHYIFLSTYRIYADEEHPVKETSPRLLDVSNNEDFIAHKETEYSLYKAMGENMLSNSPYRNWTIVRPAITYSSYRFQLTTLEANVVIYRMRTHKTLLLPEETMKVEGTMSWAGDVAKMIARLLLNKKAFGERYTVSTAEHHPWKEIADFYVKLGGLKYKTVDHDTFMSVWAPGNKYCEWQLQYDRMFDRVMDNSKILNDTGMKQSELMPLNEGLKREISNLPADYTWPESDINSRMDAYLNQG